jgi:PAS domain S-box-containing protein
VGLEKGLSVYKIKLKNGIVQLEEIVHFEGIDYRIQLIAEQNKNEIWLSSEFNGIFRLTYDSDDFKHFKTKHFTKKSGLPGDAHDNVQILDNQVLISTEKGIFVPKITGDSVVFKQDISKGKIFTTDSSNVAQILSFGENYLINSENQRVGLLMKDKQNSEIWDNTFSKRFPSVYRVKPYDNLLSINTGVGLYFFDMACDKNYNQPYKTLIRKVFLKNDSVLFAGNFFDKKFERDSSYFVFSDKQNADFYPELKYKNNSLTFEFAASFYEEPERTRYRYILEGFDENWSNKTTETKAVYTNIPGGNYVFKVKAENVFGNESTVAEFHFTVLPPWYKTIWAYIGYVFLFFGIIFLSIYAYSRRLKAQNRELEKIVKQRTMEIFQQKEEIKAQAEELQVVNESLSKQAVILEEKNIELEKLSIVARETDNAIVIMDQSGNFEWVNAGFTRLYGFTLAEFSKSFGNNILKASSNPHIKEVLELCINEKHSKTYESTSLSKTREKLWVQTTVTPIFDVSGNISKLIAIDSDISEIKAAEIEIKQKSEEISAQNELLELKNSEITQQSNILKDINERINSSIRYALTIQNAILPSKELIDRSFENFILYKPKDIVSGDFYWFIHVPTETSNYYFAAAADCTGHGVPGAFMSMIGSRLLNEAVNEKRIYQPNEILEEVNKNMIIQLKQDSKMNSDGMDLCLVRIEKNKIENNYKIIFCGAKRPLFIFKNSENELVELRPNRRSIGGSYLRNITPFTQEQITTDNGDILYLSTDGLIDQNNAERKKFSTPKITDLLKSTAKSTPEEQRRILETELNQYMTGTEQRDDITLFALKLSEF